MTHKERMVLIRRELRFSTEPVMESALEKIEAIAKGRKSKTKRAAKRDESHDREERGGHDRGEQPSTPGE